MPLPCFETLSTPRLQLSPVAEAHLDDLLRMNGDDAVTQYLPYATWATRADGEAWLARMQALQATGGAQQRVLQRRADGRVIGSLLLFKHDEGSRRIELGYALARDCWGQGWMREAVQAACAHAFGVLQLRRIEAEVNPDNAASCALLARLGFTLEGRLRQRWTAKGRSYDTNLYGLLDSDARPAA
ncbi:GNAT family N-acetyltransferase [Aquabacterium sp. OR-4]|uniref:GNAT family N-acetyltransferase n=1 Tax=Aquabacterium sp. OR-4 TaxID=2978127 RepID=UPI0021B435DE|nr:GNAT family protein [Aquabacterium sp. OR-4]MDT7834024.1 GNAT family protein [Aquabacterium sp. OR-4]